MEFVRASPATRLGRTLRRGISFDSGLWWLVKALVSHFSARKLRRRQVFDPSLWREVWEKRDLARWPTEHIHGILSFAGVDFVLDRAEMSPGGLVWIDGWTRAPAGTSFRLEADSGEVTWQSVFRTQRRDVIETLKLSLSGAEANIGFQLLAKLASVSPPPSNLALIVEVLAGPHFAVPVTTREEHRASFWHSLYEEMRYRGPRTVDYLDASVKILREIRKADWRERAQAVRQSIEQRMTARPVLKVLLLSRHQPHSAYVNLTQLAAALDRSADFIVCSIGQAAASRADEVCPDFAERHGHTIALIPAETGMPSSELIEQFLASCERRQVPALIVYDDVAVAGATYSVRDAIAAMAAERSDAILWRREAPGSAASGLPFVRTPTSPDDLGPYWTMTRQLTHGALGAALIQPGRVLSDIPPFEGRGLALEYLARTAFGEAAVASTPMLDLVEHGGQSGTLALDTLMLMSG